VCNEFVHGVGKMVEFFGQIMFLHKYGKIILALRMPTMDVAFSCL
jgi:hypothetical protein